MLKSTRTKCLPACAACVCVQRLGAEKQQGLDQARAWLNEAKKAHSAAQRDLKVSTAQRSMV